MTHSHQGADEYTKLPSLNWRQYLSFSTDHKTIGVQYLLVTFFFSTMVYLRSTGRS